MSPTLTSAVIFNNEDLRLFNPIEVRGEKARLRGAQVNRTNKKWKRIIFKYSDGMVMIMLLRY